MNTKQEARLLHGA